MNKHFFSFCVIAAGILWGTMSIFVRSLSELGFSSKQIMLMRSLLASGILAAVIALKNSALFKIHLCDIWIFIGSGILSMAFFSVCYFSTIIECGASVAVVLLYTSPVFVLILSAIFFKEKITFFKSGGSCNYVCRLRFCCRNFWKRNFCFSQRIYCRASFGPWLRPLFNFWSRGIKKV